MSWLLDRESRATSSSAVMGAPPGSPIAVGLLGAAQAAGASLTVVLVPVVLAWATASYSTAPWSRASQLGIDTWLLAHHTGIVIPGGHVGLVPLGLLLAPLIACWLAGVRIARSLDPSAEAIRTGVGRATPSFPPARALVAMTGGYAVLAALACAIGATGEVRPLAAQAVVGAAVISAAGGCAGAATWAARGRLAGLRLALDQLRLPDLARACLRPAALVVGVQLAAGLALFGVALLGGRHDVFLLQGALKAGIIGGLVLTLAQLAALPNLAVWAVSYAAGPGFAVGSGTAVAPGQVRLGALPAVPVLGALPDSPLPAVAALLLPVLVAACAAPAGRRLLAQVAVTGPDLRQLLTQVAVTAGLVALAWLALGWLAGGAAGPGRLSATGPVAWWLGLTVGGETLAGLLLTVGFGYLVTMLRPPTVTSDG